MALQVDTSGDVKKIKGIYKGQQNWQAVGTELYSIGDDHPFFTGVYQGDDSVSVNIFFDPSRSQLANTFGSPRTGLIQVGDFFINHYAIPIDFYNRMANTPDVTSYINFNGRQYPSQTWYPDVCREDSKGNRVQIPYYAFWQLSNEASYNEQNFLRFPQTYGGLTKYDPQVKNNSDINRGENLTAFISCNESLGLGDLAPALTLPGYVSSIDPNDFYVIQTPLTADSTYEQIDSYLVTQGHIPQSFLAFPTRINKMLPDKFIVRSNKIGSERILLEVPRPAKRSDGYFNYFSYLLICENPEYEGTLGLIWMDDDFANDYTDAKQESAPDVDRIKRDIESSYCYSFYNPQTMTLSKQFVTFACYLRPDYPKNTVYIQMLEGIEWGISNFYSEENEWSNLQFNTPFDCTLKLMQRFRFKNGIERFYSQLSRDLRLSQPIRVVWLNDFKTKYLD